MNHSPKVLVIGLGLIGASFAQALKLSGRAQRVWGHDADADSVAIALKRGIVDAAEGFEQSVAAADVIMLAVPVLAVPPILTQIAPWLASHTLITDVGSVKGQFAEQARQYLPQHLSRVVPGHPIAGAERSGVTAAQPELFLRHQIILTPLPETRPEAVRQITWLWQACGARVSNMAVDHHDRVLAATSHLPHLLAFCLVDSLAKSAQSTDIFQHAAGGFRDFTRIAASSPVMWRDVFLANDQACLAVLSDFEQDLSLLKQAIISKDARYLETVFTRAKSARQHFDRVLARRRLQGQARIHASAIHCHTMTKPWRAELRLPGDVLLSQQLLVLTALALGDSRLHNLSRNQEVVATRQSLQDLGIIAQEQGAATLVVHGQGPTGLAKPAAELYLSETQEDLAMMLGLLAAQPFASTLVPGLGVTEPQVQALAEQFQSLGLDVRAQPSPKLGLILAADQVLTESRPLPQTATPLQELALLTWALQQPRLLTLPAQSLKTRVCLQLLQSMGAALVPEQGQYRLRRSDVPLRPLQLDVPVDAYLGTFYVLLTLAQPGARLSLRQLPDFGALACCLDRLQAAGVQLQRVTQPSHAVLKLMDIEVEAQGLDWSQSLQSSQLAELDEVLPLLLVLATQLQRASCWQGLWSASLDCQARLEQLLQCLTDLGAHFEWQGPDLWIQPSPLRAGRVSAQGDCRMALALMLAGALARGPVVVEDVVDMAGFYPEWHAQMQGLGLNFIEEAMP